MAGKPGMHTRALNPARVEEMRQKIRGTLIIKKLEEHVVDNKEMSATQVSAALGLLRKIVPDLAAINHSGEVENKGIAELIGKLNELEMTGLGQSYRKGTKPDSTLAH